VSELVRIGLENIGATCGQLFRKASRLIAAVGLAGRDTDRFGGVAERDIV
jgi:hypothetical protein